MTKHRYALLAFALLCLLPSVLFARSRVRQSGHARLHVKARISTTASSHSRRVRTIEPPRHSRVERTRNHTRRATTPHLRKIAYTEPRHAIQPPLVIKARPAPESRQTSFTDPSERPDLPSIEEAASTPEILPSLYNKRGLLIMPPPMRGTHEILLHQNEVAMRDGLKRIQDDTDLDRMRRMNMLVPLPVSSGLQVDERLPLNRRYSRPWTAQFLATLARAHYARFHTALQVNSAVRTVEFQQRLIHTNGNAAPAQGETASPHLTGQAIDLAKHGLSLSEIAWMRGYLLPYVQSGKIDVEEEFQQACFHISVYRKYLPPASLPAPQIAIAAPGSTRS